jgi:CheY-like chemotaxis protein
VKHVVVVEDDAMSAMLFRNMLERRGSYRVTVTEDPAELLRLAREGGVDLVLMDVSLANSLHEGRAVSGVELCRVLKQDPATVDVPVVLATAHAMRGDEQKLLAESGADAYVAKPIMDQAAFVARIGLAIEGRRAA